MGGNNLPYPGHLPPAQWCCLSPGHLSSLFSATLVTRAVIQGIPWLLVTHGPWSVGMHYREGTFLMKDLKTSIQFPSLLGHPGSDKGACWGKGENRAGF